MPSALAQGEYWGPNSVTFVNPIPGISIEGETTNSPFFVPGRRDFTNEMRNFPRPEFQGTNGMDDGTNIPGESHDGGHDDHGPGPRRDRMEGPPPPPPDNGGEPRGDGRRGGRGRPPWMNQMSDDDFKRLVAKRELHGLVLVMSAEHYRTVCVDDLWLR